jgi:hypothetical protein
MNSSRLFGALPKLFAEAKLQLLQTPKTLGNRYRFYLLLPLLQDEENLELYLVSL